MNQDAANRGYRLREQKVSLELAHMSPTLPSGDSFLTTCGPLLYSVLSAFPSFYNTTLPAYDVSTSRGIQLDFWSSQESLVVNEANFEHVWTDRVFAQVKNYPDFRFNSPWTVTFKISDYCLGWTMSPAKIKIVNADSVEQASLADPTMLIKKLAVSDTTIFEFSLLDYTQTDLSKVNEGCGNLVY